MEAFAAVRTALDTTVIAAVLTRRIQPVGLLGFHWVVIDDVVVMGEMRKWIRDYRMKEAVRHDIGDGEYHFVIHRYHPH